MAVPEKICPHQISGTSEYDIIWGEKRTLKDITKDVKIRRSFWTVRHTHRDRHRGHSQVTMEAKAGVRQAQAKECMEPAEAGRGQDRFSPAAWRWRKTLPTPRFQP